MLKGFNTKELTHVAKQDTLEVAYQGKNIAQVLETPIEEGGEAQRVKLAGELGKLKRGKHNLYILDEPTTGLHFADIDRLLESLNRLVDSGHSVFVIEHNLDVIKTADYVIDLGPAGGHKGGQLIAAGTPEDVAACQASFTGRFLRSYSAD